jgi:predicted RNA-binding protein with PUA-like domain
MRLDAVRLPNRLSVIPLTDAEFDAIVTFAKRQRRENRA